MKNGVKIVFEDNSFLIIDKPAGLVVHSDGRTVEVTLSEWVEEYWRKIFGKSFFQKLLPNIFSRTLTSFLLNQKQNIGNPHTLDSGRYSPRCGVVNRLDRETSGLVIIAKNNKVFTNLQKQLQDRLVEKKYSATLHGHVDVSKLLHENKITETNKKDVYKISEAFSRHKKDPRMWVLASDKFARQTTRDAETLYEVGSRTAVGGKKYTNVFFWPLTGRTHQLRLHAKFMGHPIVGDKKYSFGGIDKTAEDDLSNPLALRAIGLSFIHPKTKKKFSLNL